jgi:hypothetical protein
MIPCNAINSKLFNFDLLNFTPQASAVKIRHFEISSLLCSSCDIFKQIRHTEYYFMNLSMNDTVAGTGTTTASTQPTERHYFFHKLIQPLKTAEHNFKNLLSQKRHKQFVIQSLFVL